MARPDPLASLVEALQRLPGIGARSAQRLAYHLLKTPREEVDALCNAMRDVKVFHSGTAMKGAQLVTDGGRVLGVTALGETIAQAQQRAYDAMKLIHFDGMHYRTDIGHYAVKRA